MFDFLAMKRMVSEARELWNQLAPFWPLLQPLLAAAGDNIPKLVAELVTRTANGDPDKLDRLVRLVTELVKASNAQTDAIEQLQAAVGVKAPIQLRRVAA